MNAPALLLVVLMLLLAPALHAEDGLHPPWPFRYLLVVEEERAYYAGRSNADDQRKASKPVTYLEAYLQPTLLVKQPNEEGFAVFLLEFDRQGRLLHPRTKKPTRYVAIYTHYPEKQYFGGVIKLGRRKASGAVTSLVILGFYDARRDLFCNAAEADRIEYEDAHPPNSTEPVEWYVFGCRDWTWQMQHPGIKVIDVTSWREEEEPRGEFIPDFLGFARFDKPKKPVWGKHLGRYYCLADCPEGRPGVVKWKPPPCVDD